MRADGFESRGLPSRARHLAWASWSCSHGLIIQNYGVLILDSVTARRPQVRCTVLCATVLGHEAPRPIQLELSHISDGGGREATLGAIRLHSPLKKCRFTQHWWQLEGRSVGRTRRESRGSVGSGGGRSVGRMRLKIFAALRAAEGRSVGRNRVGIRRKQ